MSLLSKSIPVSPFQLGTTNTTPANRLLAASATVGRWLRGITVVNNSAGTLTWNFAVGTGAILTAANSLWFGASLVTLGQFTYAFPGKGLRLSGTDELMGFASGASVSLVAVYDELDIN